MELQMVIERVKKNLDENNPQEAFNTLRPLIGYPAKIENDEMWTEYFSLFKEIAILIAGEEFANIINEAVINPNDPDLIFNAANEVYQDGLYDIAATILLQANKVSPGSERIVSMLAICLSSMMLFKDAYDILISSDKLLEESSMIRYLAAHNILMTGNLSEPVEFLPTLKNTGDVNLDFMVQSLEDMLGRSEALKSITSLDNQDLRGWHFLINRSLLLHLSPFGFDDGMNGRYAYTGDCYELCKDGVLKVKALIDEYNMDVPVIFHIPGRSSKILGLAASKLMGIPLKEWPAGGTSEPGLIVAYDLHDIDSQELFDSLSNSLKGQILWAHANNWIEPYPFTPDIATYMYQANQVPWEGGVRVDSESSELVEIPDDKASDDMIAMKIIKADKHSDYFDDVDMLLKLVKPLFDGGEIFNFSGERLEQYKGSPVSSHYFI